MPQWYLYFKTGFAEIGKIWNHCTHYKIALLPWRLIMIRRKLLPQRPAARVLFWGSFGRRGHPAAGTTVRCGSVWVPTALACVSSLNLRMQCLSKHTQSNESHFGSSHKYVQIHFPTHLQQIERFPQFYETKNYIELCLVTLCVGNLPKNYILFSKKTVTLKVWWFNGNTNI